MKMPINWTTYSKILIENLKNIQWTINIIV